jgi:hypothetical protein
MMKALMKEGIEGTYLNIIKATCDTHRAICYSIVEKIKAFILISEMRQSHRVCPLLFKIVLEFIARAIRQEKERKVIQIGKEDFK